MTRSVAFSFLSAALLATAACGPKQFGSVCDGPNAPPECNTTCDATPGAPNTCAPGFHCSLDGTCNAQCTQGGGECGDGFICTTDGRCMAEGPGSGGPDADCPDVNFTAESVTPSIGLLLDQSGSMYTNNFGNVTRYQAMRDALVAPNTGVVSQLESKVYFGAMLYTDRVGNQLTCDGNNGTPIVGEVARGINNAAGVRSVIDAKLNSQGGNTPTHRALDAMVASFQAAPPPADSPPIIVLATDGLPNNCADSQADTRPQSVAAAAAAHAAGIPVYVLAVAQSSTHFQDLANAGQGVQQGQPNATYYIANDAQSLANAFQQIIGGVVSCDLSINGTIDEAQAMSGNVTLNGQPLQYGSDWVLVNGNTIRLQGAACDQLKNTQNPTVNASFPCGAVILKHTN